MRSVPGAADPPWRATRNDGRRPTEGRIYTLPVPTVPMSTGRLLYVLALFAVFVFSAGFVVIWALSYGPL